MTLSPATRSVRVKTLVVLSCAILFLAFAVLVITKPIAQDEGVFLTIGKYLDAGSLPYQDFFDHKPPAIHFLFALLFGVFGTNVFVVKVGLVLSVLGAAFLVLKIGEMLRKGSGWYAVALFLFLMTQFEGYFLIAEPFLLLPLLLSLLLLLRSERRTSFLMFAGLSLGTVLLFKQTAVLSALPLIVLAYALAKKKIVVFLAGLAIPLFLTGAYLFARGVLDDAFHQVVTLTLTSYPREPLSVVLPWLRENFLWTLPVWVLLLVGLGAQALRKGLLWTLVLLPLPFLFFRHYPHYWVQVLPFVALLAAGALADVRSHRVLPLAMLVFCLAVAGGKVAQDAASNFRVLQEQFRVASALRNEPADFLLVENQFTAFSFLLPQKPLNDYLYITEITDAEDAEQRTMDDLLRNGSVLVLWPEDPHYAYAKQLQDFLEENATEQSRYPLLGLRVLRYEPATSR